MAAATKQCRLLTPLPVVGLSGSWATAPDGTIDAQAQYFRLESSGYEGYWSDLRLGTTWWFGPKLGVGLACNRFANRIGVEGPSFDGRVRFIYSGLQAYLTGVVLMIRGPAVRQGHGRTRAAARSVPSARATRSATE